MNKNEIITEINLLKSSPWPRKNALTQKTLELLIETLNAGGGGTASNSFNPFKNYKFEEDFELLNPQWRTVNAVNIKFRPNDSFGVGTLELKSNTFNDPTAYHCITAGSEDEGFISIRNHKTTMIFIMSGDQNTTGINLIAKVGVASNVDSATGQVSWKEIALEYNTVTAMTWQLKVWHTGGAATPDIVLDTGVQYLANTMFKVVLDMTATIPTISVYNETDTLLCTHSEAMIFGNKCVAPFAMIKSLVGNSAARYLYVDYIGIFKEYAVKRQP